MAERGIAEGEMTEPETDRGDPIEHRRFEMALDFPEALRLARHLDPDLVADPATRRLGGRTVEGAFTLTLGPERRRTIALLSFAIADVDITLAPSGEGAGLRFFDRFMRVFQKGGG